MKRLFLIDGTALAYRSHFAIAASPRGGLTTKQGRPTSAVYGFTTTLLALLEQEAPDALAVSFDGPTEKLERTRLYPEYKSTRAKMPDELAEQLDLIRDVVAGHGIAIARSEDHEADDVIGTLAVRAREAGMEVFIVTSDKDFMQLVDDHLRLWNLRASTRAPEIIGPAEVEKKFGVPPGRMLDLLALMGDSSDNVPGVPRVGQKTAASLLQRWGTLEEVLAHAGDVQQPSIRKALQEHREQALLSRELVRIRTDVDTDVDVTRLGPAHPDRGVLEELFRDLEFESLLASLPQEEQPEVEQVYRVVAREEELEAMLAELRAASDFALDTEAAGSHPRSARPVGIAFAAAPGRAWYVPLNAQPPVVAGGAGALLGRLRPLLEDPAVAKSSRDAKRDMGILRGAGIELRGLAFDTQVASYCVNPGAGQHHLDALALRLFSYRKTPAKELTGTGRKQRTFAEVDVDEVGRHAAENADFTWRARGRLRGDLEQTGTAKLFAEIEMPLIPVLLDMEWEGIAVDLDHLARVGEDLGRRIQRIEDRIYQRAGEPFNLNSPAQIAEVLFGKLEVHRAAGMTRPKRTRTGQFKTDAAILERLAPHHEVPELLLEYRRLSKLKGTWVDSLPGMVHPATGRIHTTYNQAVAATGRLSSDNPNLQNIPIRTEEGREVRRAFVARGKGWTLLSADYSQIELRILAHMSGDPALIEAFRKREDIHAKTAALVQGVLPGMVTPQMRSKAKVVNYGLMYGMGPSRLAAETGMRPPEARQFIQAYFRALPRVKQLLDDTLAEARRTRVVHTMFGRRRPLPDIDSANAMQRIAAENMAVNTPIQGTAADIIKRAMLTVHARLRDGGLRARLLLQVHDELVLDVPEDELAEAEALLAEAMRGAADLAAPLEVSLGHGRSWLEAH